MNSRRAYEILELEPGAAYEMIRRQYKMLALKYHPDKNCAANAADKYREIKEAHDLLCADTSPLDRNTSDRCSTDRNSTDRNSTDRCTSDRCTSDPLSLFSRFKSSSTYARTASNFFEMIYNDEHFQRHVFHPLLMKLAGSCEDKSVEMFEKMDRQKAKKLYDILIQYQETLHLSDDFFVRIHKIIEAPIDDIDDIENNDINDDTNIIMLNPNIDDLIDQSVYKLKLANGTTIIVPLWHRELEYDGVLVNCIPELPKDICLDEYNNIHVQCRMKIGDLLDKKTVGIQVGSYNIEVHVSDLRFVSKQMVNIIGRGIPVPDDVDIFNVSQISSIYVHIEISNAHIIS
jgi:curved DNA-binding protein CbpA